MEVGVRELKNHLSRYLARVVAGDQVTVTDRGRAIAKLTPLGAERPLDKLIAQGIVTRASVAKHNTPTKRALAKGPISPLVAEQRR